jgi:ADP-heptose:LPS heptosyltransferase
LKILIVKLHALGDLVIATPAFRRLREGLPNVKIDLLTTEWTAPAAKGNNCFDEMLVYPNKAFFSTDWQRCFRLTRLASELRRRHYDAAVLFHKHPAINRLVRASGIRKRIRFGNESSGDSLFLDEGRHSALTAAISR